MLTLVTQAAKEKALQLERKRKAASFLALLAEKKTTVRLEIKKNPSSSASSSALQLLSVLSPPWRMVRWLKSRQRLLLINL